MKNYISKTILIVSVITVAIAFTSCSTYVVGSNRPGPVVVVRPAPPYYAIVVGTISKLYLD